MLKNCPECELLVSDKATFCPHCGFPFAPSKISVRTSKRRRLPNGFGQITEIKGRNLRNPFRVMVTTGKDNQGNLICHLLKPNAYFPTYNAAYTALVEYNKDPYDLSETVTVSELYERWRVNKYGPDEYLIHDNDASSWLYCGELYDMEVRAVRAKNIRQVLEHPVRILNGEEHVASPYTTKKIKSMLNRLFDFAVTSELVTRNVVRTVDLDKETAEAANINKTEHKAFTDDEIAELWNASEYNDVAQLVLIQAYTGLRPQEIGLIEMDSVHLDEHYFTGGMKTAAGKDRIIPIHPRIAKFVELWYNNAADNGSKYLFYGKKGPHQQMTYSQYRSRFTTMLKNLNLDLDHRAHDPRKHFVTMAKKYKVDDYAIKRIVGHKIPDITESIYTERPVEWLLSEVQKIK